MKFLNKILTLLVIVAWLLPAVTNATALLLPAEVLPLPAVAAVSQPAIAVVSAPRFSVAVNVVTAPPATICDQAPLNLNQPASCFNLSLGRVEAQPLVVVVQPPASVAVGVAMLAPRITSYHLASGLPDSAAPVLPAPAVGLLTTLAAVALFGAVTAPIKKLTARYKASLSLSQLQMLRC